MKIAPDLEGSTRPIGSLVLLPGNPRRGDVEAVAESLRRFGQRKPIVVNADDIIIAGNHTYQAAVLLGWTEIAVSDISDLTATEQAAYALADNKLSDLAHYDPVALRDAVDAVHLEDADLLEAAGFNDKDLRRIQKEAHEALEPKITEEPGSTAPERVSFGDVWSLGAHTLVCGDATVSVAWPSVPADLVWTDPPYGVDLGDKNRVLQEWGHMPSRTEDIVGDKPGEAAALLSQIVAIARDKTRPGAAWFVCAPAGPQLAEFILALGEVFHYQLVWVKNTPVFGRSEWRFGHENILLGATPAHENLLYGSTAGAPRRGPVGQPSTVLRFDRPTRSPWHPSTKPTPLIAQCLVWATLPGELVVDPFAGAGSTLLACEDEGRRAWCIELEPVYCDATLHRWETQTGEEAVKVSGLDG